MKWKWRFWQKADAAPLAENGAVNRRLKSRPVGLDGSEWHPSELPRNGTVGGFVEWLSAQLEISDADDREWAWKLPRIWQQKDLYEFYQDLCRDHLAKTPVGIRRFARELDQSGCQRWPGDLRVNGIGARPMMVTIPELSEVKVPVSLRVKSVPPYPRLPKGPGIMNGSNSYAAIKKHGGASAILVKAA